MVALIAPSRACAEWRQGRPGLWHQQQECSAEAMLTVVQSGSRSQCALDSRPRQSSAFAC
eukprot:CAMPEP_0172714710 /NCGR_PEP_ID=MMETSP1074-20121228/66590_1 /TAXON_ID=2916 /ORGANISM="Ceratium fusus, Strain PA161109" /LENGTH=59 /DNA_ID=CAMNT_0013539187 /DNA_START=41 /DNA_END=217 /DNA_ORIENTATION=+